jgi:purine-binding chemotaxis protein CheW
MNDVRAPGEMLVVSAGRRAFGIPLPCVREILRPLPIEVLAGSPPFVRGLSMIRGAMVPVVDLLAFLTGLPDTAERARLTVLSVGDRRVAIAVDGVVGVRTIEAGSLAELPPLLRDVGADSIDSIGTLDGQFLLVLRNARVLPESLLSFLPS